MSLKLDLQIVCEAKIPAEEKMIQWLESALEGAELKQDAELTLRIVEKSEIEQLNGDYRNQHKATNVLSFPFEIPGHIDAQELAGLLGDLVICADVVNEEAQQQRKSVEAHWAHMCIHGVLHLLGFDHIDAKDAAKMEALEIDLLSLLGYADPYQD